MTRRSGACHRCGYNNPPLRSLKDSDGFWMRVCVECVGLVKTKPEGPPSGRRAVLSPFPVRGTKIS